jgi:hypothetical protein
VDYASFDEYADAEMARGPLAFAPDTMGCYACGGFDGQTAPKRKVVGEAGVTPGPDPTTRYRLECGHVVI